MHFKVSLVIYLLLCAAAPLLTNAQTIKGIISDNETNTPLLGVVVVNKTKNQTTLSDENGKYEIVASAGNEIEFSYLGYYALSFLMPEEQNVYRSVWLKKKLISLNEIEIRPDYTPYQLDSMERRKIYGTALSRQKVSSTVLGSIMSPASALAEQFSTKSKQRFRFQKNYTKWESQKFIETRYTADLVNNLTGLTGDTLAQFMNMNPIAEDYARTATELELKMWIKYNYRQWQKKAVDLPITDSTQVPSADTIQHEK